MSICVPLYNTPLPFLREMVASVLGQTCPNWQLCLADASDAQHAQVGEYVQGLGEGRIRYVRVENRGISANTNEAAKLATGDYLALLDHDDVLAPNAVVRDAARGEGHGRGVSVQRRGPV